MKSKAFIALILLFALFAFQHASSQEARKVIPPNSKVFVASMPDGFDEFLKAAIEKKKVPLQIVAEKDQSDFQITGQSETQKASTAKKVIMWDWRSNEQASIQVSNLKTSEVVFAYSVNKVSSAHGKKSSAEACAKHLKEKIVASSRPEQQLRGQRRFTSLVGAEARGGTGGLRKGTIAPLDGSAAAVARASTSC